VTSQEDHPMERVFTHPDAFALGTAVERAETASAHIDLAGRQARPASLTRDHDETGFWGGPETISALVTCFHVDRDYARTGYSCTSLLMVDCGDGWVVPGGRAKPGETPSESALRYMAEAVGSDALHEMAAVSGVAADWRACRPLPPRPVPGPGPGDDAWAAVTVPVEVCLGAVHDLPVPAGAGGVARRAAWVPAVSYGLLAAELRDRYGGGRVLAAHAAMIADFIDKRS
jgi:8-oxo-dGTP pyrophosphatase MutT (NUDIX family)